jgi:hypothetical protein
MTWKVGQNNKSLHLNKRNWDYGITALTEASD